jgi:hypothetical protein
MKKYDNISIDFHGYKYMGEWEDIDDDLTDTINFHVEEMINEISKELEYYKFFKKCIEKYTKFEIEQVVKLNRAILKQKSNIDFGEGHLRGESRGTYGKDCSTKLDKFRLELNRLSKIWNEYPEDLRKLISYDL